MRDSTCLRVKKWPELRKAKPEGLLLVEKVKDKETLVQFLSFEVKFDSLKEKNIGTVL